MSDRRRHHGLPRSGTADDALDLFEEAMRDVQPLDGAPRPVLRRPRRSRPPAHAPGARRRRSGDRFDVRRAGNHLEGRAAGVAPGTLGRLRRGEVEPELRVDLHGFPEDEARGELRDAFRRARSAGIRCVLVIHGRGLRSPAGPVLKEALPRWLTDPPLAAWVLAFASAPGNLGGTGATLVLLRERTRRPARRG
ncbi:MAG: Smr/MutS family protein [Thermoanaerobaculia bacterium]